MDGQTDGQTDGCQIEECEILYFYMYLFTFYL